MKRRGREEGKSQNHISSAHASKQGKGQANGRGKVAPAAAAIGVVGVEALSRKATCLLFIHLESDAHKVNPCVRHWARHNTHTTLLTHTLLSR